MFQTQNDESHIPINNEIASSGISLEEIKHFNKVIQIFFSGDFGVGKSSLFRRYIDGTYNDKIGCSVNPEYYTKDYEIDNNRVVTLKFVDFSGYELFSKNTRSLYEGSSGAMVIFDITRIESFNKVEKWKNDIDEKVHVSENRPIPCLLIANKIDCCQDEKIFKTKDEIGKFIHEKNFINYFEISVKEQLNLDEPLKYLINYIIDNNIEPSNNENVKDDENSKTESDSSNCFLS